MQLLKIRLLGGFDLIYHNESIASAISERLRALIAYLVLYPDTVHQRQHLAFLLWPGSTESQARTNVRRMIHTLRQLIPEIDQFIVMEAQTLQWRSDASFSLDLMEFEQVVTIAEAQGTGAKRLAALEKAADLYQGKLLPSCHDAWIKPEQKRLQQHCIEIYTQLIQILQKRKNYLAVIQYSQKLLRIDPLNESAYLNLMQSYIQSGDRSNALQSYHRCCTILGDELGIEPSAGTKVLYEQLL